MSGKEQRLLITILALLVAFGLGYFGFRPLLATYHSQQIATAAREAEIRELEQRKEDLATAERQLRQYGDSVQRLTLAAPSEPQYAELLTQLATMAEAAQVELTAIQPTQASQTNTEVVVTISVRGAFPELLALAEQIETNIRPIRVQSINFSKSGDPDRPGELAATLQLGFARTVSGGR